MSGPSGDKNGGSISPAKSSPATTSAASATAVAKRVAS